MIPVSLIALKNFVKYLISLLAFVLLQAFATAAENPVPKATNADSAARSERERILQLKPAQAGADHVYDPQTNRLVWVGLSSTLPTSKRQVLLFADLARFYGLSIHKAEELSVWIASPAGNTVQLLPESSSLFSYSRPQLVQLRVPLYNNWSSINAAQRKRLLEIMNQQNLETTGARISLKEDMVQVNLIVRYIDFQRFIDEFSTLLANLDSTVLEFKKRVQ
jgi:hypothetical protein